MDIFKDLGKKLGNTAKTVGKKSEELVEITKLNLAIGNEEDKIKKLLVEIGSEIYAKHAGGEHFGDFVDEKCSQIGQLEQSIEDLRCKVKKIKGQKSCAQCGTDIDEGVQFCPKCGSKLEE